MWTTPDSPLVVEVDELQDYMSGISLNTDQMEAADEVIRGLQTSLENFLNRPVVPVERTERLVPDWQGIVRPRVTPVIEVLVPVGLVADGHGVYVGGFMPVTITYRGGIDGPNTPDIRLAVMRAASREMTYRHDDAVTVKGLSVRNEGEPVYVTGKIGWTEEELLHLERYRKRVIAS